MLTIRPHLRSTMPGRTALVSLRTPLKLTSITRSQKGSSVSRNGCSSSQPALFTRTSIAPSRSVVSATAAATESVLVTSSVTAIALPPFFSIARAVSRASSPRRSPMATARPSAASFSAIPRPIPRAAPLTKATLFTGRGYTALCRLPEEDDLDYETLIYEQDEHVVTLTYNRPDQHNAVNRKMNSELHHAWQRFRDDDHAFVLVITGAGSTTFCAGWDLGDAAALSKMPDFDEYRISMYNS